MPDGALRGEPNLLLPSWARDFMRPARYKVAYGGRGSAKSWTFARLLVMATYARPLRVLCARELQGSIRESVHELLSRQIESLGLSHAFKVGESYIRGANGSVYLFKGLRHNAVEIKSTEGVDICWVEEGQAVSNESWKFLIPTVRKAGSEIWVSLNTGEETDATYRRLIANPPPRSVVRLVNWNQNPWFNDVLNAERLHDKATDYDAYLNIWEGQPRMRSAAQVLRGKWMVSSFIANENTWDGPYYGADWGFSSDPTVLTRSWVYDDCLFIDWEAGGLGVELDDTPALFDRVPGAREHLIRADSARPETIRHMQTHGYPRVIACNKWSGAVHDGIARLRGFKQIIIHPRCSQTAREAQLWRHKTDRLSGDVLPALEDGNDHAWDSIRYALEPIIRNHGKRSYAGSMGRTV